MMKISALRTTISRVSRFANKSLFQGNTLRSFSTGEYDTSSFDNFIPTPPVKLTVEMAEGISDTTQFYVRHGVSKQRLQALSREEEMPAVTKWQKMMEIFLTTQVHVISGLGYSSDEKGLTQYAQDLAQCLQETDDDMRDLFTEIRRDTWRELVAAAFDLQPDEMKALSIVDARNLMHKVSSKMVTPEVLLEIQSRCAKLPDRTGDEQLMLAEKHRVVSEKMPDSNHIWIDPDRSVCAVVLILTHFIEQMQDVIVNHVYLSGNPSLIEEAGFGSGEKGYAKMQCAMSDHEGDPLINEYAAAAMAKIWEAAGLDLSAIQRSGM